MSQSRGFDVDAPLEVASRSLSSGAPVELVTKSGRRVRGPVDDIEVFASVRIRGRSFPLAVVKTITEVAGE